VSANSGEEIYSGAIVTGQTPDGQPVRRSAGQPPGDAFLPSGIPADQGGTPYLVGTWTGTPTPTFNGGTNTWTWDPTTPGQTISAPVTASGGAMFLAGSRYRFDLDAFIGSGGAGSRTITVSLGNGADAATSAQFVIVGLGSADAIVDWEPQHDYASATVTIALVALSGAASPLAWQGQSQVVTRFLGVDLISRRGFRRRKILPISNALPSDLVAAQAIGNTWLPGHKSTPFKGSTIAVGNGTMRDILTGEDVPPERLLLKTTEMVRFSDRLDPDTGGHGRDGRIAGVRYTHNEAQAEVTIDNSRQDFESLMARLGVLSGQG